MKKIYAILAFFMFLGFAGSAFAAAPQIQLTGYTPISDTQAKLDAFYSIGDAQSLDLYFYWDTLCSVYSNQSSVYHVTSSSGNISYTVNVPKAGTYCYRVVGMKHMADGTSDFVESSNPASKEFKTASATVNAPQIQNTGATGITSTSALLNAYYNSNGSGSSTIYFMYGPASLGTVYKSSILNQSSSNGDVATTVSSLTPNTQYVYRAYITTSYGTVAAVSQGTFTTLNNTSNPTCKITSFYADAPSVVYGGSTVIRWTTTGCTNANLNTLGGSVNLNDSKSVGPLYSNVTYVLNANSTTVSDSQTLTITVGGVTPPSGTCKINSFYADDSSINYGSSTTLRWVTTGCSRASLSTIGSVSVNGYQSTGALYSTITYTLDAWGTGLYYDYDQQKTITVTVNNNGGGCQGTNCQTKPSCYYTATCYWNGTQWVYSNTGGCGTTSCGGGCTTNCGGATSYPGCYYTSACYWSGTAWVYSNNGGSGGATTYPSCYYNGTCSCITYTTCTYYPTQTNPTYVPPTYTSPVYNPTYTQTPVQNYNYNPHTAYTGGPNYVTQKLPAKVNTVYIDQQTGANPVNQVVTSPSTTYTGYYGYNNDYTNELMAKYANDYNYQNQKAQTNLLTGSAGSNGGVTLIGLLIILIIIAAIVYFVRSSQDKQLH